MNRGPKGISIQEMLDVAKATKKVVHFSNKGVAELPVTEVFDAQKFAHFIRCCKTDELTPKGDPPPLLVIVSPEMLGDNHSQLIESLNCLSDSGSALIIVPRRDR